MKNKYKILFKSTSTYSRSLFPLVSGRSFKSSGTPMLIFLISIYSFYSSYYLFELSSTTPTKMADVLNYVSFTGNY